MQRVVQYPVGAVPLLFLLRCDVQGGPAGVGQDPEGQDVLLPMYPDGLGC